MDKDDTKNEILGQEKAQSDGLHCFDSDDEIGLGIAILEYHGEEINN